MCFKRYSGTLQHYSGTLQHTPRTCAGCTACMSFKRYSGTLQHYSGTLQHTPRTCAGCTTCMSFKRYSEHCSTTPSAQGVNLMSHSISNVSNATKYPSASGLMCVTFERLRSNSLRIGVLIICHAKSLGCFSNSLMPLEVVTRRARLGAHRIICFVRYFER